MHEQLTWFAGFTGWLSELLDTVLECSRLYVCVCVYTVKQSTCKYWRALVHVFQRHLETTVTYPISNHRLRVTTVKNWFQHFWLQVLRCTDKTKDKTECASGAAFEPFPPFKEQKCLAQEGINSCVWRLRPLGHLDRLLHMTIKYNALYKNTTVKKSSNFIFVFRLDFLVLLFVQMFSLTLTIHWPMTFDPLCLGHLSTRLHVWWVIRSC